MVRPAADYPFVEDLDAEMFTPAFPACGASLPQPEPSPVARPLSAAQPVQLPQALQHEDRADD
jgi:hypothetical protein